MSRVERAAHLEVRVDVLRDDVLGFRLVLTVDDVHVQLSLVALEQRAQFADVLAALFDRLQENTAAIQFKRRNGRALMKPRRTDDAMHSLVVPIVDGFDVAEYDLVLALLEIVGNRWRGVRRRRLVAAVDAEAHERHVPVHDEAEVAHVVALRVHQFLCAAMPLFSRVETRNERNNERNTP